MKRILLIHGCGGLGDALAGLAVLKALRRLNPGAEFGYCCIHSHLAPSWARALPLQEIGPPRCGANGDALADAKAEWAGRLEKLRGSWEIHDATIWSMDFLPAGDRLKWPPLPLFLAGLAGVELVAEDCRDVLEVTEEHRARARALAGDGPAAVIMSGPGGVAHWLWPPPARRTVALFLQAKGLRVLGLAGNDGARLPGVIPVHGQPVQVGAAVIAGARLYAGMDSGPSWLAVLATRTPSVVVTRKELSTAGGFRLFDDPRVWNLPNGTNDDIIRQTDHILLTSPV